MNSKQKERVKKIIQNDCQLRHYYCDMSGQTCAIGALLREVGYTDEKMRSLPLFMSGGQHSILTLDTEAKKLSEIFGLTTSQLDLIQNYNDAFLTPEERRDAILKFLDTIFLNTI